MQTCGLSLLKYIFFAFNLIFAITGIILIAIGGFVIHEVSDYKELLDSGVLGPPIVLIVAGIIIFIIAFLGCCGAITENYKMLIAFGVFLLIVFIVELSVGIAAAVAREEISDAFKTGLKESMSKYSTDDDIKEMWDQVQTKLQCCGVDSPNDWLTTTQPPDSCKTKDVPPVYYDRGCYDQLKMDVQKFANVIMGIGIGIAFVEVIGVIIAFLLAYAIRKGEK